MNEKLVHENPWFSVSLTEAGAQRRYRVLRPDSALVVGLDAHGELLMIRGTRDTTGSAEFYEFPCGGMEPGEDPVAAAVRETREETGWDASGLVHLGSFVEAPGVSAARCHVYSAVVTPGGVADLDSGEDWTAVTVRLAGVMGLVSTGQIQDAGTLAALALYRSISPAS